ncbi:TonB-dependent receptor plug domain-containing protein [Phenylobacterium sp.]|jgi:iron complex outermembrane receptor protein|uniref:TonB-dependent receptor plug domain-containing protein n=1 Tax=Phenylobacterium sp. TaxID=1871053 RepID=UPI002F9591C9
MLSASVLALAAVASPALADVQGEENADQGVARELGELSIDELSQISITSVSKRPEALSRAASSAYVITPDAIRSAGALTIPEALRLAPNLEVMRIDALDYSITARGFAGFESANKLLVLIDGRSVYTPLFSGVDWDQHHALLEDLDRIEVISGPGGVLWGANAVNGVVNVASKSAFDTQGLLAAVNAGTLDSDLRLRVGRQIGDVGAGRVYFTAFRRGDLKLADGDSASDGWDGWQGGFRTDWAGDRDTFTIQGDIQDSTIDESLGAMGGYVRGGNLLGRWTRRLGERSALEFQAYYDQIEREARLIHDELRVWDVQGQHSFSLGRHNVVWGAGYRITRDEFRTLSDPQLLSPPKRRVDIGNVFVQDEIALSPELMLTLGLKLETNTFTRAEWMPNVRLGWQVTNRQFVWGAVSRAIRNPSRIERDFTLPGVVEPGRMGSEKLVAYELGYRGRVTDRSNVSVSLFYHDYDQLRTNEFSGPGGQLPIFVGNTLEGETYGLEAWADIQVADWWRVSVGGAVLEKHFRLKPGSLDISQFEATGADPGYWAKARSHFRITERLSLDVGARIYDEVPRLNIAQYVGTRGYVEAGARLAWQVTDQLELAVTGLNLLHDQHPEASEARRTEVPRSAFISLRWTR